jgi:glycosyltransferase involved in cell wall biosynthesis
LYIGRKAVDKGYPLVVAAFQQLRLKYPDTTLVCMGPAALGVPTEPCPGVVELNFASEDEKHDALAACTCLCVPSEGESFGLVYMEAGRYQKPVIGRKLPVLEELLGPNRAASLLGSAEPKLNRAGLTVKELAAGIQQLLDSPELALQIGRNCLQVSERYLWPTVVEHFESAYYSALADGALLGRRNLKGCAEENHLGAK